MFALRNFKKIMVLEIGKPNKVQNLFECKKGFSSDSNSYDNAIKALNSLQTNAITIQQSISRTHNDTCSHVQETEKYLRKVGITLNDLDKLSVIHVSGTKGKGTTCALVESILRNLKVKTGFYSSPHLAHVTERIRLNGTPISEAAFTTYFWKIYNTLEKEKQECGMPPYFKFLTIMAYYIFLKEKVDVAIIEVGIGGEHDCTNVIRNTQTVGISSISLEHTQLLGKTHKEIAWQKSGIIKDGSNVFTVNQLSKDALDMIKHRCDLRNAKLKIVPPFEDYKYDNSELSKEFINNPTKQLNMSLAVQLSCDWIKKNQQKIKSKRFLNSLKHFEDNLELPAEFSNGLLQCFWPGRCQVVQYENMRLYIDGAHTVESLQICMKWFKASTSDSKNRLRFVLFNVTGGRNGKELLDIIHHEMAYELALFTPNISSICLRSTDNTYTFAQPDNSIEHSNYWDSLHPENKSKAFGCISDVISFLSKNYGNDQLDILVTGSLHLVGEVLKTINN